MVPAIYLEPFPGSTQEVPRARPRPAHAEPRRDPRRASRRPASSGWAARPFPTHVKLKLPEGKRVDTLIINGVECEPYLTTDHRVMLEQRTTSSWGIRYL
jgi:electron transport complex protein RnfC